MNTRQKLAANVEGNTETTGMRRLRPFRFSVCLCLMGLLYIITHHFKSSHTTVGEVRWNEAPGEVGQYNVSGEGRQDHPSTMSDDGNYTQLYKTLREALEARHMVMPETGDKVVILVSVDSAFLDMAVNLWEVNFHKFDINNFLFICTDIPACKRLQEYGLASYKGKGDKDAMVSRAMGSTGFARKSRLKEEMTLPALRLGFTVFVLDADVIFLKNPFPYFNCTECDLITQSSGKTRMNTGFMYVRPTPAVILMYELMLQLHRGHDQIALNIIYRQMKENGTNIKLALLPEEQFVRGNVYFQKAHRMFATDPPCPECVMVHNCFMFGAAGKIYRTKEFLWWMFDKDGYYTNPNAKYLTYNNPIDFGNSSTITMELGALRTAMHLGHLLNRIVILPKFHCYDCRGCGNAAKQCSLNTYINIKKFDEYFDQRYREHMFLDHPKVAKLVLQSRSPIITIKSIVPTNIPDFVDDEAASSEIQFIPKDQSHGADSKEIFGLLEPYKEFSILRFHSLYWAFKGFSPQDHAEEFEEHLQHSIIRATYMQNK